MANRSIVSLYNTLLFLPHIHAHKVFWNVQTLKQPVFTQITRGTLFTQITSRTLFTQLQAVHYLHLSTEIKQSYLFNIYNKTKLSQFLSTI